MIKIYTDGSCIENPGNGGWAAIIFMNNEKIAITGNKKNTTNNQMELMAAIEALKKIPTGQKVQVYTDSKYVKLGITEWIEKWSQNNWKTSSKQKVKNLALWTELNEISKKHKIEWFWVKGHAGDPINEEVDTLAKKAA
ncbi:uncharacterized protein METZ01_LOCUS432643, partial [marine metagenome]